MYGIRHRIKTKEEMIATLGTDWRNRAHFPEYMDYLHGMHIDVPNSKCDSNGSVVRTVLLTIEEPDTVRKTLEIHPEAIISYSTLYAYRIKTEDEFIRQYGRSWRHIVHFNSGGLMDYLLGAELTVDISFTDVYGDVERRFPVYNSNRRLAYRDTWVILPEMVMKKDVISYKPRATAY